MKADPIDYGQLDLHVHEFLADVELHDVWVMQLAGIGAGRTIEDVRLCFESATSGGAGLAVRALFALRAFLGRVFGWDRETAQLSRASYIHRLSERQRETSLVVPGTADGSFRIVYELEHEALSEIQNATVHAFSCFALRPESGGYLLYWGIYVKPVGRITAMYMRIIDPFRYRIVYPGVIKRVEKAWRLRFGDGSKRDF